MFFPARQTRQPLRAAGECFLELLRPGGAIAGALAGMPVSFELNSF